MSNTFKWLCFVGILSSGCVKKPSQPPIPPQPVVITKLEKDDVSITAFWTRSDAPDFAAYELYALNTVAFPLREEPPDGRLVARIEDREVLSARDDSVDMYYAYSYKVKVITTAGKDTSSAREAIEAGSFINASANGIYDRKRQKIYSGYQTSATRIDPLTLTSDPFFQLPFKLLYWNMDSTGNTLQCIFEAGYRIFQAGVANLDNGQITLGDTFTLGEDFPDVIVGHTILYDHRITGPNFSTRLMAYDLSTKQSAIVFEQQRLAEIKVISGNRVMLTGGDDSIRVFQEHNGSFSMLTTLEPPVIGGYLPVFEGKNLLTLYTRVYDQSFNVLHEFPEEIVNGHLETIMGVSNDDRFIFTSDNNMYETGNWQLVANYGTGAGGPTYFSNDMIYLFHYTYRSLGSYFMHPSTERLFRYPVE